MEIVSLTYDIFGMFLVLFQKLYINFVA